MNMNIYVVGTSNQLFIPVLSTKTNVSKKKKYIVTGKTLFFVIGPFCTPHFVYFNLGIYI